MNFSSYIAFVGTHINLLSGLSHQDHQTISMSRHKAGRSDRVMAQTQANGSHLAHQLGEMAGALGARWCFQQRETTLNRHRATCLWAEG
jgi:hypothetical protein